MGKSKDGGPAFPEHIACSPVGDVFHSSQVSEYGGGMSLRDWFAGQALAGLMSTKGGEGMARIAEGKSDGIIVANAAYAAADAMLAAREASEPGE